MKAKNLFHITVAAAGATMLSLVSAGIAQGASIANRATLNGLLGGGGILEDFESFNIGSGSANIVDCGLLNSSAICDGQGPELVLPGIDISGSTTIQWNGSGYFGSTSREILGNSNLLNIDFNVTVDAFGLDLRAFSGFPATASMTVFATDDTTVIGTISNISLLTDGVPVFAGWEDLGGIGRVSLTQTGQRWSPIIDNLEFGDVESVPEPLTILGTTTALGFGALFRKRKTMKAE